MVTRIVVILALLVFGLTPDLIAHHRPWHSGGPPLPTPTPTPSPTPTAPPNCGATLQSFIDSTPSGGTLFAPTCLWRETVVINKPMTLVGGSGQEIRGSDVWSTGWTFNGTHWTHPGVPVFPATSFPCLPGTSRCNWPEQVFYDGQPLFQVASNPTSGQFSVDANRVLYLANTPVGHTVEVTTRLRWVIVQANNVTIRGFRMKHAAASAEQGGINGAVADLTLESNFLSDSHGPVINIGATATFLSPRIRILNNDISRGGSFGIALGGTVNGSFDGSLIQLNHIFDNNTESYDYDWGAGGFKFTRCSNVTIDNNEINNNFGPGAWLDISCLGVVVNNNRVHDNYRQGIFFEISQTARITANKVYKNGVNFVGPQGSGIYVSSSSNAEVDNNTLAWNGNGIVVQSDTRPGFESVNGFANNIHNNVIVQTDSSALFPYSLGWLDFWNGTLSAPASNNRGSLNRYGYSGVPEGTFVRFSWGWPRVDYRLLAQFNATPGEEGGTYLTLAEQDGLLTAAGIPIRP